MGRGRGRGRGKPGGKGRRSVKKREEEEVERGRDGFLSKSKTPHPKGSPPMRDLSTNVVTNRGGLQPMKELWDVENVHIPKELSLETVLDNVKQTMAQRGFHIRSVDAYAQKKFLTENKPLIKRLRRSDVNIIESQEYPEEYPGEDREFSDLAMMQRLSEWVEAHDPPAAILLLTSDWDFFKMVQNLSREQYGFVIWVVGNNSAPEEIRSLPTFLSWENLRTGLLLDPNARRISMLQPPPSPPRRRVSLPIPRRADLLVPVFWDLTCPIDHFRPQHIYGSIDTALKALGYLGVYTFDLFVQSNALNGGAIDMLRRSGVEVHISQPPTKTKKRSNANRKGFPDIELGKAMHSWALERNPSPMLLISSDSRLRTDVSHITSLGFEIILFHTKKAPKDLKDLATKRVLWFDGVSKLTQEYEEAESSGSEEAESSGSKEAESSGSEEEVRPAKKLKK